MHINKLTPMLKKVLFTLALAITFGIGSCLAQANDSLKNKIIIKCQFIDSLRKFNDVNINEYYLDGSTQDGQITTLKKNENIVLIELFTQTFSKYFYFENEELIQAIEIKNNEINNKLDSSNENKTIEIDHSKVLENRFYFCSNNLISYNFYQEKEYDRLHGNNSKLKKDMIEASAERIKAEAYKLKERYKTK